ncbi:MAG TPA: hypothetical protein VG733_14985, partial [Chthoniobacteraceae bacterium]|nr:hypothetical protein [Chthoniobacteraceae bacterium]
MPEQASSKRRIAFQNGADGVLAGMIKKTSLGCRRFQGVASPRHAAPVAIITPHTLIFADVKMSRKTIGDTFPVCYLAGFGILFPLQK